MKGVFLNCREDGWRARSATPFQNVYRAPSRMGCQLTLWLATCGGLRVQLQTVCLSVELGGCIHFSSEIWVFWSKNKQHSQFSFDLFMCFTTAFEEFQVLDKVGAMHRGLKIEGVLYTLCRHFLHPFALCFDVWASVYSPSFPVHFY